MTLEILISTYNSGIEKISRMLMPQDENISYLVSWQQSDEFRGREIPEDLLREDVRVVTLEGKGLSRNRNNALKNAKGDICLLADDDIKYNADALKQVIKIFEENKDLELATFQYSSTSHKKYYPTFSFNLRTHVKFYYVSSIEIGFRRTSVQGKLEFNELLGLGAPVAGCGEESLFILTALALNLRCQYYPIAISTHEGMTTSQLRGVTPATIIGKGAIARIKFPSNYFLRYFVIASRMRRLNKANFFKTLYYLFKGGRYAKKNKMFEYDINEIFD